MRNKKVYVKEDSKVKKYNCTLYDKTLCNISKICKNSGYVNLYNLISLILKSDSTKHFSYALNNLITYYPENKVENEIKEKVLYSIWLLNENKNIDLEKFFLNLEYQMDKKELTYYCDDTKLSKEIVNLPYKSYFKQMGTNSNK